MMREDILRRIEPKGHELRAEVDEAYKRATWGRRPEDAEDLRALMAGNK